MAGARWSVVAAVGAAVLPTFAACGGSKADQKRAAIPRGGLVKPMALDQRVLGAKDIPGHPPAGPARVLGVSGFSAVFGEKTGRLRRAGLVKGAVEQLSGGPPGQPAQSVVAQFQTVSAALLYLRRVGTRLSSPGPGSTVELLAVTAVPGTVAFTTKRTGQPGELDSAAFSDGVFLYLVQVADAPRDKFVSALGALFTRVQGHPAQ